MFIRAQGLFKFIMDSGGRIRTNDTMLEYFAQLYKDELDKLPENQVKRIYCNIGFPEDPNTPALVLLNDIKANEKAQETIEEDMKNIFKVPRNQFEVSDRKYMDLTRRVEIKSKKIQFTAVERKQLNLPDDDRSVIVHGSNVGYMVWSAREYAKQFPDFYKRFELDKENPDNE